MPELKKHQFRPIAVEIEEAPLPVWEWLTLSTIVFSVAACLGFLCLGEVDIVVGAHGKVVPQGQILVIQPLETGVLRRIHVKPGDSVRKGQLLMEVEPELIEPALLSARAELGVLSLKRNRVMALISGGGFSSGGSRQGQFEQALYDGEKSLLEQELRTKESETKQVLEQRAASERALKESQDLSIMAQDKWSKLEPVQDILSSKDIDPVKEEMLKHQSDSDKLKIQLSEYDHKLMQIESQKIELRRDFNKRLLKELDDSRQQELELNARLREHSYRNQLQRIIAPADGVINERFINTEGGVVTPAEKLMTLVPDDKPLEIEALADNHDVGFIKPGMKASIKIDTFDYQKYGLIDGVVKKVASDSIKDEKLGQVFVVSITPNKTTLKVEGKETPISSGMTVESEIKVGKRKIIEFFLNPILKSWNHSVSLK